MGGTVQPDDTGGIAGANPAVAEYAAYGVDLVSPGEGIARLRESLEIWKKMFTEPVFDFTGRHYQLTQNRNEPKPVHPGGPPILIGGWGDRTLRLVAEYADIWNVPGPPHNSVELITERMAVLDAHCAAIGRDPAEITRSSQIVVSYDDVAATRETVRTAIAAGIGHVVLSLPRGYPPDVAHWLVEEVVVPLR